MQILRTKICHLDRFKAIENANKELFESMEGVWVEANVTFIQEPYRATIGTYLSERPTLKYKQISLFNFTVIKGAEKETFDFISNLKDCCKLVCIHETNEGLIIHGASVSDGQVTGTCYRDTKLTEVEPSLNNLIQWSNPPFDVVMTISGECKYDAIFKKWQ